MSITDDHVAIRALIMQAALVPDQGDLSEYREIYTEDATWGVAGMPAQEGVDAIIAASAGRREQKTGGPGSGVRHLVFPMQVTVDGDTGTGVTYLSLIGDAAGTPSIITFGVYADRYVRTADGWRIQERIITSEAMRK